MTQALPEAKASSCGWLKSVALASLTAMAVLGGCSTTGYYAHRPQAHDPSDARIPAQPAPPRTLAMFEGDTGRVATWADLMEGIAWADVVFVGEYHDHRAGHQVELAIYEDALAATPGTALSLEMFERDDQVMVDKYLKGEIDQPTLVEETKSKGWGPKNPAKGSWEEFYQPLVDTAKAHDAPIIAANAPRKYVRQARKDGYAALAALPPEEKVLFDTPTHLDTGAYRKRFEQVMVDNGADANASDHAQQMESGFRSQQVWDATMAKSIAKALDAGVPKVVHCVGSFHVDWQGGTMLQLREIRPSTKILVVTVVAEGSEVLQDRDRHRADIVIYAARGPNEGDDDEEEAAPSDAAKNPHAAPATATPPEAAAQETTPAAEPAKP